MIDQATRSRRLDALRRRMDETGCELTALAPSDNLRYVIGFSPKADERACMLLVGAGGTSFVMPGLNAEQTSAEAPELELVRWSDDAGPSEALRTALERVGGGRAVRIAVDPEMRADHLLLLQQAVPEAEAVPATTVVGPLREAKSAEEIAVLQTAAAAADEAMTAAFSACRPGATELDVADAVASAFRRAGAEEVLFAIVGAGSNGAFPHHHTSSRRLEEGDAIVIDIGARSGGYVSDITRMAYLGDPSDRYFEVHAVVEAAVRAAMAAAGPGTTCHEVDAAARGVIEDAGYGEYFVHRCGHGLGLSVHEPPWIMGGNDTTLRAGMVHSIEPGIYLPGEFGIRLEEIVQVTDDGCRRFSRLPRDVHVFDPASRGVPTTSNEREGVRT
ncbi:MAG TPA: Xaa-Pro peptidase family protein [Gaiellaceae bacterium]|nr:Xaa-Pro peptidase family protein [Gaiellaceae bacterium]